MIYKNENWGFNDLAKPCLNNNQFPNIIDGDIFLNCNLSRWLPNTKPFTAEKLFFDRFCCLTNIDIDDTWILEGSPPAINEYFLENEDINV